MAGNPTVTIRSAKMPKQITGIAMPPLKYYELKVYIKSIVVPGTVPFECARFTKENKQIYRQWLNKALEEIGPRFFSGGEKGLVWPEDYKAIYKAVHHVVRVLSLGIRKNYKRESKAALGGEGDNEMKITKHGDHYGGKGVYDTGATDVGKDAILDEYEKYAQWEEEEKKAMATMIEMEKENQAKLAMIEMGKENQAKDAMKGMDAEPVKLEDLLGLMKPDVFAHFPDLENGYFDWDEIMGTSNPEPVRRLANLD